MAEYSIFGGWLTNIETIAEDMGIIVRIEYSTDFGWDISFYKKVENGRKLMFSVQDYGKTYCFREASKKLTEWYETYKPKGFCCPKCKTDLGTVLRSVTCPNCGTKLVDLE